MKKIIFVFMFLALSLMNVLGDSDTWQKVKKEFKNGAEKVVDFVDRTVDDIGDFIEKAQKKEKNESPNCPVACDCPAERSCPDDQRDLSKIYLDFFSVDFFEVQRVMNNIDTVTEVIFKSIEDKKINLRRSKINYCLKIAKTKIDNFITFYKENISDEKEDLSHFEIILSLKLDLSDIEYEFINRTYQSFYASCQYLLNLENMANFIKADDITGINTMQPIVKKWESYLNP